MTELKQSRDRASAAVTSLAVVVFLSGTLWLVVSVALLWHASTVASDAAQALAGCRK